MKKCPKCGRIFEDVNTLCPSDGAVLAKDKDALVGRTLADKYRIEERISEGGMGTVYRGTHILMEKAVAIKVLHPALAADEKIVARFTREARAASRISHPHALTVTDFGENADGIVFLVMEYLRGSTLKQVARAGGPMPLGRVVEIARQIAGALDAAHAEGVVHRDLKSDNIMLCETGGTGGDWAKVLDFGIAKIQETVGEDQELTAPNLIIGTPQYMSPEQCSNVSGIDYRSDIYSFGIILFEMLAGHVPFTGDSATAIMLKHVQEPPPSLLEERDDLPPGVEQVVTRALAKLPEDRQQSAGELAEALATAAEGELPDAATAAAVTAANRPAVSQDTNRIVVPTSPNDLRSTAGREYDDETVVRDSGEYVAATTGPQLFDDVVEPPPAASFNPWKVIVPAGVLLVALLGVFFAFSRDSSGGDANANSAPLTVDPAAAPVQTASPPTGAGETGIIPASGQATPAATQSGLPVEGAATPGATPAQQGGTPQPEPSATREGKQGNQNSEGEEEPEPEPSSTPPTDPTPKRATPTPPREGEDPPPRTPAPTPTKTPPVQTESPAADPPPPAGRAV